MPVRLCTRFKVVDFAPGAHLTLNRIFSALHEFLGELTAEGVSALIDLSRCRHIDTPSTIHRLAQQLGHQSHLIQEVVAVVLPSGAPEGLDEAMSHFLRREGFEARFFNSRGTALRHLGWNLDDDK
jgi:hypothetical protein